MYNATTVCNLFCMYTTTIMFNLYSMYNIYNHTKEIGTHLCIEFTVVYCHCAGRPFRRLV